MPQDIVDQNSGTIESENSISIINSIIESTSQYTPETPFAKPRSLTKEELEEIKSKTPDLIQSLYDLQFREKSLKCIQSLREDVLYCFQKKPRKYHLY